MNNVQLDIRNGHDQTIQKILKWIEADGDIKGKTVCDCGCGVGSLAIPLAQMGECMLVWSMVLMSIRCAKKNDVIVMCVWLIGLLLMIAHIYIYTQ